MARTTADPFADLLALQEDMERLFEQLGTPTQRRAAETAAFAPPTDVFRRDGDVVIHLDLPGLDASAITVSVTSNQLTIKGSRNERQDIDDGDYVLRESRRGEFERRITMPEDVDATQVRAQYRAGVLEVTVPRTALAAPEERRVSVASSRPGVPPREEGPAAGQAQQDASARERQQGPEEAGSAQPGDATSSETVGGTMPEESSAMQGGGTGTGTGDTTTGQQPQGPLQGPSAGGHEEKPRQRRSFGQWLRQET